MMHCKSLVPQQSNTLPLLPRCLPQLWLQTHKIQHCQHIHQLLKGGFLSCHGHAYDSGPSMWDWNWNPRHCCPGLTRLQSFCHSLRHSTPQLFPTHNAAVSPVMSLFFPTFDGKPDSVLLSWNNLTLQRHKYFTNCTWDAQASRTDEESNHLYSGHLDN